MNNIIADEKIPGLEALAVAPFSLKRLPLSAMNALSIKDADILIVRSVLRVDRALLEGTNIRIVATVTSGTDHIDTAYLQEKGIPLFSAPGCNAPAVVDYMLWMIAYLAKYQQFIPFGKTAGIIGAGHVGTGVAALLKKLDMEVIFHDPPKAVSDPAFISHNLEKIAQSDLICVHAELSRTGDYPSYHMLSTQWFNSLNPSAIFINAARGAIIDTPAFLAYLDSHPLQYCLDVFEDEPHVSDSLIQQAIFTTPHIAGHTVESFARASQKIVGDIMGHVEQKKIYERLYVDALECQHWYDVILKLYDFHSPQTLTEENFYTFREYHRSRHDFSAILVQVGDVLPTEDKALLVKLIKLCDGKS